MTGRFGADRLAAWNTVHVPLREQRRYGAQQHQEINDVSDSQLVASITVADGNRIGLLQTPAAN